MDKRPMKTVGESRTEQVQIVLPGHSNGDGRLFGGRLMEWIDVVAAVVARRHITLRGGQRHPPDSHAHSSCKPHYRTVS